MDREVKVSPNPNGIKVYVASEYEDDTFKIEPENIATFFEKERAERIK